MTSTRNMQSHTRIESKPNKASKHTDAINNRQHKSKQYAWKKKNEKLEHEHKKGTKNAATDKEQNHKDPCLKTISQLSREYNIPVVKIKQVIEQYGIKSFGIKKNKTILYDCNEILKHFPYVNDKSSENPCDTNVKDSNAIKRKKIKTPSYGKKQEEKQRIYDNVTVAVRERLQAPETAVVYTGPTNSGKTHRALDELKSYYESNPLGTYVYAGPLRMLAFEVYEKLKNIYGDDAVGFVTGEEQINPKANIKCCTVEMAPSSGDLIVLDEAHWMVDNDRGQHWTNLLVGGAYRHFRVITATEAQNAIIDLLSDADDIEICECKRMTSLKYGGQITPQAIPSRSAVVAFSRRTVYAIAREISKRSNLSVGVLYGALPLRVRKEQIRKYIDGEYDIMITTDVIGHGINLPIDNVIFAETEKYDGHTRRQLKKWEASQIAGRAGRYGYSDTGTVYALSGLSWLSPDIKVIKSGVKGGSGQEQTDLKCEKAFITPQLEDLRISDPSELAYALQCWQKKADNMLEDKSVCSAPMSDRMELIAAISAYSGAPGTPWARTNNKWMMTLEQLWSLSGAPLDPNGDVLVDIVAWANSRSRETSDILEKRYEIMKISYEQYCEPIEQYSDTVMRVFESTYSSAQQMETVFNLFGTLGSLDVNSVKHLMHDIEQHMIDLLDGTYEMSGIGRCRMCGAPCAPWFALCADCYSISKQIRKRQ